MIDDPYLRLTRWFAVRNISGEVIPSFAPMRISKLDRQARPRYPQEEVDNELVMLVSKPDAESEELQELGMHCFNGPYPIEKGAYGQATCDFPVKVRHHPRDVTFTGDTSGFVSGQWYVSNRFGGDSLRSWDHAIGTPSRTFEDCIWAMPNWTRVAPKGRFSASGSGGSTGAALTLGATVNIGLGFDTHAASPTEITIPRAGLYRVGFYGIGTYSQNNGSGVLKLYANGVASNISNTWQKPQATISPAEGQAVTLDGIVNRLSIYDMIDLEKNDVVTLRVGSNTAGGTASVSGGVFCLEWIDRRFSRSDDLADFAAAHSHG